jgi:hypothetical protein
LEEPSDAAAIATEPTVEPTAVATELTGVDPEAMEVTAEEEATAEEATAKEATAKEATAEEATAEEATAEEATAKEATAEPKDTDNTPPAATTTVCAQTTILAQRAQAEPASLLGAQLSATWVNETFTCEVMMIREGKRGRFEALVRYEADGVEQWEVIGEPPYKHTLIAEPADMWLRTGSALIGEHTLERIGTREFEGVIMAWLPKREGYESLYKIYHLEDGDFEELDDTEVNTAIKRLNESRTGALTKE